ncbi:cytochrome ubiquinol oxidase subunit I [Solibacillus sp. A46]|uniref:Cytochrome ubiquinol oxidase subunit I n=1 Tax=Solibacillus faecavium TaxID=2762221 RepID=A0ABR8Y2V9_9BACL|nr:cytochrome ubiquinol oxidase subunit I [Solibacillus faecavium]MBD8038538.1 cytochrome ubiquinol oxidase subunit I [Solibacillus faecavium]
MDNSAVFWSRALTELTLTFHIIFATLGVGVPLIILIAQYVGYKKNDEHYTLLARRVARGFTITVAVGVVTGTIIGLQLSLLWPQFMELAGQTIALPLFMETFAFFFEAIFLGIYLYTWDRFKNPIYHMLLLIPVAIGAFMSAIFITIVNAFMNAPRGFDLVGGEIINIQPILAMFTPAMPTKVGHVLTSSFMTVAFTLAAIAAYKLLKGENHIYHKKSLNLMMKLGLIFSIATAVVGDFSAKYLAEYQPEKLAAAEWHFETEAGADLIFFGILDGDEVKYEIRMPKVLSFLISNNFNAEVTGLNDFPEDERPPLITHYYFNIMVAIGSLMIFLALGYVVGKWRGWQWIASKWFRWLIVLGGPLSFIAIETGWWLAEQGRQPWILYGIMRTEQGATTATGVEWLFIAFAVVYLILGIGSVVVLRRMFKNNPVSKELALRKGGEQ